MHGAGIEQVHFHDVGRGGRHRGRDRRRASACTCSASTPCTAPRCRWAAASSTARTDVMPVPGPGTAELRKGFPVVDTGVRAELVTPTGAAILTTLAVGSGRDARDDRGPRSATARGTNGPSRARRTSCAASWARPRRRSAVETVAQVETTIDDMNPQLYEPLMDRLFEAGALDAFLTPS